MNFLTCAFDGTQIDWTGTGAVLQALITGLAIYFAVRISNKQFKRERAFAVQRSMTATLGRLKALEAELLATAHQAEVYMKDKIMMPAYRLPLVAYRHVYPAVLTDGVLSTDGIRAIDQYFKDAVSFNYCLDAMDGIDGGGLGMAMALQDQYQRAKIKAMHLVPADSEVRSTVSDLFANTESRYDLAMQEVQGTKKAVDDALTVLQKTLK